MANPTTNFGWVMPTSSSLVTNLPADFNTFGQAVDTSLQDLLGGTTGQVLSKTSATNMDFTWIDPTSGDITGVTAGTGISGGGTSGTVTVTNSMATAIDAKGDLIGGTGADTFSRLAVGANGTVLTADSAEATGLKWATPSGGPPAFVGAKVYKSANQSIPNATWTTLTFNSESFDTDGFHDTSSNTSRMTIPSGKGGKYLVQWQAAWDPNATGSRNTKIIINGGTTVAYGTWSMALTGAGDSTIHANTAVLSLSVADYIEIQIGQGSGGNLNANGGANDGNTFSIIYLGA
jgi:hypothetical protein